MKPLKSLTFLFVFTCLYASNVFSFEPIVYSRCLRTTGSIDITGTVTVNGVTSTQTRTNVRGLDIYDVMPDVSHFFGGFSAPCDLIYRDANGNERVLYNCSTAFASPADGVQSCAALDPAVSFDGKSVVFAVFEGTLTTRSRGINAQVINPNADNASAGSTVFPNLYLTTSGAHIVKVDIATGALDAMPFVSGIYDSGPAYLTDNRIAFTSNRDGHTHTSVWRMGNSSQGNNIWAMDLQPLGSNLDLSSHNSLSIEEHPFLLKNGLLAFSSWQIFGTRPFRYGNGSPGFFDTLANMFNIYTQAPDGAENFALYGQHSGDHIPSSFGEDHDASHFIGQTSDERVWFADYYRSNNNGLGVLVGVMQEPPGQEGIHPNNASHHGDIYVPRDVINFASWATNSDDVANIMPLLNGVEPPAHPNYPDHSLPYAGKVGHPAGLPNNGLMLSWGKGPCSITGGSGIFAHFGLTAPPFTSGAGQGAAINFIASLIDLLGINDTPGCDLGIYQASTIPSNHPNDLIMIVDSVNWHEIMAKAAVPYSTIHGITHPPFIPAADKLTQHPLLEKGTPFGLLGAASITDRETHPRDGIKFMGEHQFNSQGTDTIDYVDADLCGIRILGVMPNRSTNSWRDTANINGERVSILGEFSVLNKDASGNRITDPSGNLDTSFLVRFPANTPYLMQGIDCDGRTLNTDQTWQQLRPGEKKVCGGCHVHSKPSRIDFSQSFAATTNYTITKLGEGTVPILTGLNGNNVSTINAVATGDTAGTPTYGLQVVYDRDIQPIFDNHCVSCHSGASADAGLNLDRPTIPPAFNTGFTLDANTTWGCLVRDLGQTCVPANKKITTNAGGSGFVFRRPQLTKYIRALNSRGSLLYWKAANQRTDNKLDSDDPTDIDFGVNHPTTITPYELGLLSRWIDTGSAGGQLELLDTQKPTLHITATINNNSVTELHIGTVDLGSGIDVSTLVVCELDSNDVCLSNLAGVAQSQGVVHITLNTALSNPNTKIFASIQDLTGNITEVRRTVSWFLTQGLGDLIFKNDFE